MPRPSLFLFALFIALIVSPLHALTPRLRPAVEYSATRKGPTITLVASGKNSTPGWTNTLAPMAGAKPTIFSFTQTPPDGIVAQVITPFTTSATLDSDAKTLIVVDAAGRHEVAVK